MHKGKDGRVQKLFMEEKIDNALLQEYNGQKQREGCGWGLMRHRWQEAWNKLGSNRAHYIFLSFSR